MASLLFFVWIILIETHCSTSILKDNSKLIPFKCPSKEHYIVLGNECNINAVLDNHPHDTEYEWTIKNTIDIDINDPELFIPSNDEKEFIIYNDNQIGEIHMKLIMEHKTRRITRCDFKIIFFDTPYFGIDLGTTFSCIAYQLRAKDPKTNTRKTIIVTADPNRQYCIPTAIYFAKHDDNILFGQAAMDMLPIDATNVIYDIKRIIGRTWSDTKVQKFTKNHLFTVVKHTKNDRKLQIVIPNKNIKISPEQALAAIIVYLAETATKHLGVPYNDKLNVVISIPAFFNNGQRRAVKSIAKIAKLNAKLLVVEPTAAAIAHTYYSSIPRDDLKLFVTFDFGGGTLDCSVMKCYGMSCDVLAVSGNTALGGIDFDHVIKDIIIDKYVNTHGVNINDIDIGVILRDAENIKKSLSQNDRESYKYANKPEIIITKKEFESHEKTQELLSEGIKTLNEAIEASTERFVSSNVRMILMVGGTSNIPVVLDTLKTVFEKTIAERQKDNTVNKLNKRFGNNFLTNFMQKIWYQSSENKEKINEDKQNQKERSIRVEYPEQNPQLMVITGSAVLGGAFAFDTQAAGISIQEVDANGAQKRASTFISSTIKIKDVIPLSLGFEVCIENHCGLMSVMIPKNSRYPLQVNKSYCQHNLNDKMVTMDLFEGDSQNVEHNHFLSQLTIRNILPRTDMRKCNTFHMVFNIDENGIAEIHGITHNKDGSDNEIYTMSLSLLSKNGSLSECEIKQMQNEMVSWFKSNNIKKLLKSAPCISYSENVMPVRNYVYLDGSGSMGGFGFIAGENVFNVIAPSLLKQQTSITLFATRALTVVKNKIGQWKISDIVEEWQSNGYIGGSTYMWHMILNDLTKKHTNIDEGVRLTIITDGNDNESPSPYSGIKGMDAMMKKLIKSKFQIQFNIIILMQSKWESSRYKDLCEATQGLFYHFQDYSTSGMQQFEKEFAIKYTETDSMKIKEIKKEQQQQYEKNRKANKATVFDWYDEYKSIAN